jgi:hypothetical protein
MDFVPAKRQRLKEADFDLSTLETTSPSARGARMAPKPVGKLKRIPAEEGAATRRKSAKKPAGKKPAPPGEQGDLF